MKHTRRALFTGVALAAALVASGCTNNDEGPAQPTNSPSEIAEPVETEAPDELTVRVDEIIETARAESTKTPDRLEPLMEEADEYIRAELPGEASGSDNPFTMLENFPDDVNEHLFEIYSRDSAMLKYFSLDGLTPAEKAATALWSHSFTLMFGPGKAPSLPESATAEEGDKAFVDLTQGVVNTDAGPGPLVITSDGLGRMPLVKTDEGWLIDSKTYYQQFKTLST